MARYTSLFTIADQTGNFQHSLAELLRSCKFDIIYDTGDYMMAREVPGDVTFAKLVTVEVLIDKDIAEGAEIRMSFVVKNEELPLKSQNHCRQMFELVNSAIAESRHWKLIDRVAN